MSQQEEPMDSGGSRYLATGFRGPLRSTPTLSSAYPRTLPLSFPPTLICVYFKHQPLQWTSLRASHSLRNLSFEIYIISHRYRCLLFLQNLQINVFLKIPGFIILKQSYPFVKHLRIYKEICAPFREVFFFNKNYLLQCQRGFISDLDIQFLNTFFFRGTHSYWLCNLFLQRHLRNPITNMSKATVLGLVDILLPSAG